MQHILEAAQTIARFAARFDSAESLLADEAAFWLVVHMIEIIGEAAGHISAETRAQIQLPWVEIVAMRNRLAHGYFENQRSRHLANGHPGRASSGACYRSLSGT